LADFELDVGFCVARKKARFAEPIDQELDAGVEVIGIE
jgi:hypothetical protein